MGSNTLEQILQEMSATMTDTNAVAARRWIAERLVWEQFLSDVHRDTLDDAPAPEAAAAA